MNPRGRGFTLINKNVRMDGVIEEVSMVVTQTGPDTMTIQETKIKKGGEVKPDGPVVEWKQVKRGRGGKKAGGKRAKKSPAG